MRPPSPPKLKSEVMAERVTPITELGGDVAAFSVRWRGPEPEDVT
jgi:hypothetical protein